MFVLRRRDSESRGEVSAFCDGLFTHAFYCVTFKFVHIYLYFYCRYGDTSRLLVDRSSAGRPFPASLHVLMRFLWKHVAAPEPAFRHKCTELFYRFAPLVVTDSNFSSSTSGSNRSGPVSSRARACCIWLEQEARRSSGGDDEDDDSSKSAASAASEVGGGVTSSLRALIGSTFESALVACPMAHSSPRDWLRAMVAALDAYAWALNKGVVSVPELFGAANTSVLGGGAAKSSTSAGSKKRKGSSIDQGGSDSPTNSGGGGGVRILEAIALFAEQTLKELRKSTSSSSSDLPPPPPPTSSSASSGAAADASASFPSTTNHHFRSLFAEEAAELAELRAKVRMSKIYT